MEDPEINPHSYYHPMLNKVAKSIHIRKKDTSLTSGVGRTRFHKKKTETRFQSLSLLKNQPKIDLKKKVNVSLRTLNLQDENKK
jgi:hypothetical protein